MSYFYNFSILSPIHTKNTGCLCKQATGWIDRVKIAFPGCTFVSSHLFRQIPGKFPGKKASYRTGFFWCACLWLHLPRDCKEECLGGNPEFSDHLISDCPFGASLGAALLLSRFSRVWLCVTPETAAHQAPPSLRFSRQEHWSGLPFPSPMHGCMLSCFSHVRLCATPRTAAHQAPLSTGFSRQEHWSGLPFPSPGKSSMRS